MNTVDSQVFQPIELEILRLLAEGLTQRQIGRRLGMTDKAVCIRLYRMRPRIGAVSNIQALAIAVRTGQLDLIEAA